MHIRVSKLCCSECGDQLGWKDFYDMDAYVLCNSCLEGLEELTELRKKELDDKYRGIYEDD